MDYLSLIGHPVLFPVAVILATFLLEDPTTIGVAALINNGEVSFAGGFFPLMIGIFLGDLGLYGLGVLIRKGFRRSHQIPLSPGVLAIVLARFVPGMRTVTFTSAGIKQFPVFKFILLIFPSSVVWTFLLIRATDQILGVLKAYPTWVSFIFGFCVLALLQFIEHTIRKKIRTSAEKI